MPYLIGTDEAGYGPNLGPLVISASVWESPPDLRSEALYERLEGLVAGGRRGETGKRAARLPSDASTPSVVMADSKALYQSGKGLHRLERGLWAAFALLGKRPCTWSEVWELLAPGCHAARRAALCEAGGNPGMPMDADSGEVERIAAPFREGVAAAGVRLVALQSRVIFPAEFNETVQRCGSKGSALSRWTLDLVARLIGALPGGPVSVLCDKHGGRDRYAPVLMDCFPGAFIEIHAEGRARSLYRFRCNGHVEVAFEAKGESHLPTALASMASKYLRELAMSAMNAYWRERVPGLVPTAGYPLDAKRFKSQIAIAQKEQGIDDHLLWRVK